MSEVKEAQKFDPKKSYQWQSTAVFPLTGGNLDLFKKILLVDLDTKEAQLIIGKYEALKAIDGMIAEGVETGLVTEMKEEEIGS